MAQSFQKTFNRNQAILIGVLLALATLAVYWQVHDFSFIALDDDMYIYDNPHIEKGLSRNGLLWAITTFHAGFYIPVTWFSFLLDYELYGIDSSGYHLTNVFIHLVNILLLFLVFLRMTGKLWQSGFVVALFALHPLHVESVAWVTERKDVLSFFFFALTLLSYSWYVDKPDFRSYLLVCLAFVLGLLSKPVLVTLPFLLLLLDYWPLGRIQHGHKAGIFSRLSKLALEKTPMFILAAIISYITIIAQHQEGDIASLNKFALSDRLANTLLSYNEYLLNTFWPHKLAVLYPYPTTFIPWQIATAFLILAAITVFTIFNLKKHHYLFVGWCWFLGTLVPNIGLVQSGPQAMADRFTYIPLIGIFIMVIWYLTELSSTWRLQKVILGIFSAGVLMALTTLTWQQIGYWHDSNTLFAHTLEITKNNYSIHNNFGAVLLDQGKLAEAKEHLDEAIRLRPESTKALYNLGSVLIEQENFPKAADHFSEALRISPKDKESYNSLGYALSKMNRFDEAAFHYQTAINLDPQYIDPYINQGKDLLRQDKLADAAQNYQKALSIDRDLATAHNDLGLVYEKQANFVLAEKHFSEVVRIDPEYPFIHTSLGVSLARQGKLDEAIEQFRAELQQNPDYIEALSKLAMALQIQEKTVEARQHMERALSLGYEMPPEVKELFGE